MNVHYSATQGRHWRVPALPHLWPIPWLWDEEMNDACADFAHDMIDHYFAH